MVEKQARYHFAVSHTVEIDPDHKVRGEDGELHPAWRVHYLTADGFGHFSGRYSSAEFAERMARVEAPQLFAPEPEPVCSQCSYPLANHPVLFEDDLDTCPFAEYVEEPYQPPQCPCCEWSREGHDCCFYPHIAGACCECHESTETRARRDTYRDVTSHAATIEGN